MEEIIKIFIENKFSDKRLLLLGEAGSGKTYAVQKVGVELNIPVYKFVVSNINLDDFVGSDIPDKENLTMINYTPSWYNDLMNLLNDYPKVILFLDELTTAHPVIQGKILTLIQEGRIGSLQIDLNRVIIIGAGNLKEELNGLDDLIDPLINRFYIYEHKIDYKDYKFLESLFPDKNKKIIKNFSELAYNKKDNFKYSLRDLTFFLELSEESVKVLYNNKIEKSTIFNNVFNNKDENEIQESLSYLETTLSNVMLSQINPTIFFNHIRRLKESMKKDPLVTFAKHIKYCNNSDYDALIKIIEE